MEYMVATPSMGRRIAVLHLKTGVWYFASRYGRKAAERLCKRLNKEAT